MADTMATDNNGGKNEEKMKKPTNLVTDPIPADSFSNLVNESLHQENRASIPRRSGSTATIYAELKESSERELMEKINTKNQTIEKQSETIQSQDGKIKELENLVKDLQKQLNDNQADDHTGQKKKRKLDVLETNMNDEEMSNKVNELQVRLAEREAELEETREILAQSEYSTTTTKKNADEDLLDKVSKLVETKMKTLEEKFDTMMEQKNEEVKKVDKMMETKFETIEKKIEQSNANANKVLSFSDAVTKNLDKNVFSNVIQESKNTDRIIEAGRNRREKNLILHGVCEATTDNISESDSDYVKSFFKLLGLSIEPTEIVRLGKDNTATSRPIKLVMANIEHKNMVLSRLANLKNAEDKYRRVSVKEDYTFEERELIRTWKKKVDEKNKAENCSDWRLRGDPKNGLRLVKINRN